MAQQNKRKDIHFVDERLFEDDTRYDPEEEIPDPEQVEQDIADEEAEQDIEETEEEFRPAEIEQRNETTKKKKKRPAA